MTLYGSVLGYNSASAPLEPEGDAQISYLPFPSFTTEFLRFHHLRSSPRFLFLSVSSLSLFLSIVPYTLSPSRSIAFCVVSTLVRLFPIFSRSFFYFPFSSLVKNFSFSLPCFVSLDFAFVSSRRLSRGFFSATLSLLFYSPLWRAFMPSLPFDHNSRLTNIVNTPSHSNKTFGPSLVKFHYEINPGKYSYSKGSSYFYYYLSLSTVAVSNFITNCNKYHFELRLFVRLLSRLKFLPFLLD